MLHDLREIPVIDPFATLLALYEMLGLVFRGNAESGSKISREVTHGAIVPWASAGDASLVRRIKATRQARVPPVCGSARPSSLPAQLGLGLPHLLRLISTSCSLATRARSCFLPREFFLAIIFLQLR
jgi:hypothetical protein